MSISFCNNLVFVLAASWLVQWSCAEPHRQPHADATKQTASRRGPKVEAQQIPEIWRWCKDPPSVFERVEVLFENYPLVSGTAFNVIIRGDALVPLDDVTVKTKITVGGLFSMMDVQNLCKGTGRRCPYSPGPQEQKLTYPISLPVFGTLTTTSIMYSGHTPIACIRLGPLRMRPAGNGKKILEPASSSASSSNSSD
ncbi:hypothetical protein Efla_006949 [Eimeria flavescens]